MQQLATSFQPQDHAVQFYADESFLPSDNTSSSKRGVMI